MHPRNIYRNKPPDFHSLASKYQDFRKHCKLDLSGKAILDFKCPEAIRILTITLLKNDFGLTVDIPDGCLVPRVPARLNYILWLEDLLKLNDYFGCDPCDITGVDIGTGATCIYPLLGHKHCGWNFVASDKDQSSVNKARENVEMNHFSASIKVLKVCENTALCGFIDRSEFAEKTFDFCMCNPPFYDSRDLSNVDSSIYIKLSDAPTALNHHPTNNSTNLRGENGSVKSNAIGLNCKPVEFECADNGNSLNEQQRCLCSANHQNGNTARDVKCAKNNVVVNELTESRISCELSKSSSFRDEKVESNAARSESDGEFKCRCDTQCKVRKCKNSKNTAKLTCSSNTLHQNTFKKIALNGDKSANLSSSSCLKRRREPHSKTVAKSDEVSLQGGELAFVTRIIQDSSVLRNRVRIFTSMLGKKSSLKPLKKKLVEAGVAQYASTVFCQGKTQRWALCWTYDPHIKLKLEQVESQRSASASTTFLLTIKNAQCLFTESSGGHFEKAMIWALDNLKKLYIIYEKDDRKHRKSVGAESNVARFLCTALRNTWCNQRRKRRLEKCRQGKQACALNDLDREQKKPKTIDFTSSVDKSNISVALKPDRPESQDDSFDSSNKSIDNFATLATPLIFEMDVVQTNAGDENISLRFGFISGPSADLLYQIVQFFRNRLNV